MKKETIQLLKEFGSSILINATFIGMRVGSDEKSLKDIAEAIDGAFTAYETLLQEYKKGVNNETKRKD